MIHLVFFLVFTLSVLLTFFGRCFYEKRHTPLIPLCLILVPFHSITRLTLFSKLLFQPDYFFNQHLSKFPPFLFVLVPLIYVFPFLWIKCSTSFPEPGYLYMSRKAQWVVHSHLPCLMLLQTQPQLPSSISS